MAIPQGLSLRLNDYATYVASAFELLRHEEDLVDVTLYCEGRKIRAHKMLLSACSVYFKDIFKENPSPHPIIIFKNVKYSDLYSLVEFIYKGEVTVLQESLPSFLQTANMLSIRGLCDSIPDAQILITTAEDQPTSMLAQQILQTQSTNMNSATITTDQVYFSLPSNTTLTPQIKTDPQRTASRQYISKVLLKPAKDLTAAHSNSITPQVHQQQSISGANLSNQSTVASHPPTTNEEQQLPQGLVAQNCASQSVQSKRSATALQALVESVLSTSRPAKIARIFEQSDSSAIGKETKSTETTSTTTPEPRTKRSEMYETTAKNHVMPEFISVGEEMPTGIGDNNAYTQSEEFKMECGDVANLSESEEAIEPRNCFEQIVKMGVDNSFLDEDEQVTLQALTCCIEKTQEKKFKCDACGKSFVTWKSLSLHNEIHNGRTKCNICGAVLSRTANLKRHMKLKHEP